MTTAVLLVLLGASSRLLPHPPNFVAMGAVALFAGARLPRLWAWAVPLGAMTLSDLILDWGTGRAALSPGRVAIYAAFVAIVWLGRLGRGPVRPLALASLSVSASVLFFLLSNFAVWTFGSLYPRTPAGLALCFAAAVPFFWNTFEADLLGMALLFGLDALARRGNRRAVIRAGLGLATFVWPLSAGLAQQPAPVQEKVVVTATASSEEETSVGAATTVITRERIERGGFQTVLEVLRSVPGVDVVRSGSDGAVTSLFLRGANSTQALVLVDGQRVNSPFFAGYDFSALTTENVERIEIVQGPFSALYGSEALGGVVQVFTRPVAAGFSGQGRFEGGDAGQINGAAFVTGGVGPVGAAASYRNARVTGDRPNSDWRQQNGSARLEGRFGESLRVALEGAILDGETGVPGPVGAETLQTRSTFREERVALPVSFSPAEGHTATFLAAHLESKPTFDSEDSGFSSRTDARIWQARAADSWKAGSNTLTGFVSWERWQVDDRSNFGVNLDGSRSTIWGGGAEDTLRLSSGFVATAGLRYDHHSAFGSAWSPRGTLAWLSADGQWKLRAAVGRAFRAPSVGELYYPFSGNPNLQPERSTSYELGAERYLPGGRLDLALFWNEFRDLIVFDPARLLNFNIGRARTRGVEAGWRQDIAAWLAVDAGYTYLVATDLTNDAPLPRRPHHRAFLGATLHPVGALSVSPRVTFVGRRADFDALTFQPTENPSYVRADLFARYDLGPLAPYVRLENLADRRYQEVNGYPSPRRRFAVGLEARF